MTLEDQVVLDGNLRLGQVRRGSVLTIVVGGELDMAHADELAGLLRQAEESDAAKVVLDLRPLRFIDSNGLQAVLYAAREMGRRLWVYRGYREPAKLLELTAIDQSLNLLD